VAILESILESRLDIPPSVRQSRDFASKIQAVKVFLGVLENDVIRTDVRLSQVDPRRLASGEWDEVVFVGEILCWLGKTTGLLPSLTPDGALEACPVHPQGLGRLYPQDRTISPSTQSTVTNTQNSNLSMTRSVLAESDTTVMSVDSEPVLPLPELDVFQAHTYHTLPIYETGVVRPRCIHEVEDPLFLHIGRQSINIVSTNMSGNESYCECPSDLHPHISSSGAIPSPVRYSGWISSVDDDSEILSFEATRKRTPYAAGEGVGHSQAYPAPTSTPQKSALDDERSRILTRHNSPTQYTLALLNERARLLAELALLKTTRNET